MTDKIGVLDAFLARADTVLIGGAMCFPFFTAQGHAVGASLNEADGLVPAKRALAEGRERLRLPVDLVAGDAVAPRAAWTYETPTRGFTELTGALSVMPAAVDRCLVDGEVVRPQDGGFYGGWITAELIGPFKGGPGTMGW